MYIVHTRITRPVPSLWQRKDSFRSFAKAMRWLRLWRRGIDACGYEALARINHKTTKIDTWITV